MMKCGFTFAVLSLVFSTAVFADAATDRENELQHALQRFQDGEPGAMDRKIKKYRVGSLEQIKTNQKLRLETPEKDALLDQAQGRATQQFQERYCKSVLKKKFPKLNCEDLLENPKGKATAKANDKLENLTDTWIDEDDLITTLDDVKTTAKAKNAPWSDDYWRIQWGITSYRYAIDENGFKNYQDSIKAYTQPDDYLGLVEKATALAKAAVNWSPAEKYDLTVGDEKFTMTKRQKHEAEEDGLTNSRGDVEAWMGICHGWAPAAFMVPRPEDSVTVTGPHGVKVKWYPHDIRALASLSWANGEAPNNFVGGRCNAKKQEKFGNGRLSDNDCFDNNPATFILALGNLMGKLGVSFVVDKTFDYEVWNQPVVSYTIEYFNPMKPRGTRGKDWKKFAVPYDKAFKDQDRFQGKKHRNSENTRGRNGRDGAVKQIVGARVVLRYGSEVFPVAGDSAEEDSVMEMDSLFDLEIDADGNVTGGEWWDNNHVDFMWIPTKKSVAKLDFDKDVESAYKGKPNDNLTEVAEEASKSSYPLCDVLSYLVEKSSGKKYSCGS